MRSWLIRSLSFIWFGHFTAHSLSEKSRKNVCVKPNAASSERFVWFNTHKVTHFFYRKRNCHHQPTFNPRQGLRETCGQAYLIGEIYSISCMVVVVPLKTGVGGGGGVTIAAFLRSYIESGPPEIERNKSTGSHSEHNINGSEVMRAPFIAVPCVHEICFPDHRKETGWDWKLCHEKGQVIIYDVVPENSLDFHRRATQNELVRCYVGP